MTDAGTLLVGLGSPHGDDRIGWLVIERLRSMPLDGITLRQARSPLDLLDWLEGIERLVVCDAARGTGPPGRTRHWVWPVAELDAWQGSGSHDFSLPQVLELAEHLGLVHTGSINDSESHANKPPRVELWTVEGHNDNPGECLSTEVEAALPGLLQSIEISLKGREG